MYVYISRYTYHCITRNILLSAQEMCRKIFVSFKKHCPESESTRVIREVIAKSLQRRVKNKDSRERVSSHLVRAKIFHNAGENSFATHRDRQVVQRCAEPG